MKASLIGLVAFLCFGLGLLLPGPAWAHCDTMGGPVVKTAQKALDKGDVTPVLKWVKKDDEAEIKAVFKLALDVRKKGKEAKDLADEYFFETLVRLHRAGEGAPFTGLKPAGSIEPVVEASDKALESGSVDALVKEVTDDVAEGIRKRYNHTLETRKEADKSVDAGREYVESYVEFTHYVERLHNDAVSSAHQRAEGGGGHTH